MSKFVVVVESPAKAKTIKKYLGKGYEVLASYGHVRDLENRTGAVDPEDHFKMHYAPIARNSKHVEAIAKALKEADGLYLATDPDREGEAISWHLYEMLKRKRILKDKSVGRVAFYEITKPAVKAAIEKPRDIYMELVNAQQARRALDYLVGFTLSPLLWKKIRRGLSAGRVQSPALRMIVEREEEIENFKPREYWSITAECAKHQHPFKARLFTYQNEKVEQFSFENTESAISVKKNLLAAAQGKLTVSKIERKQKKRNPSPPFTTSTLQQEAARKLGFSTKKTMMVAQQLYEGIDVGEGTTGLITYMRTDSVNLSQEALSDTRGYILEQFGQDNLPDKPRFFKTKSKNAQEAHEAIRPTSAFRHPDSVKSYLNKDQFKLYQLIWKRTLACQMIHATINTLAITLACGEKGEFRATGSTIAKPGFMRVYQEGLDDQKTNDDENTLLPDLSEGDTVDLKDILADQHFTEPPPRYSEASLVKALEEFGIGRPSTYAAIISTLQARDYVILDNKRFKPTDIGRVVNKFLTNFFTQYVDYGFTAHLEDELDSVSRGELEWIPLLEKFWRPFKSQVTETDKTVKKSDVTQEVIDEPCPKCGKNLSIRLGKTGRFIGCTGYPECDYTRNLDTDESPTNEPEVVADRSCPLCQSELQIKQGPYGKFIGCSQYPQCKFIEPLVKPKETGVTCPKCQKGEILERKSKRGKIFYSCSTYPKCDYALWNPPIKHACPQCNWPILTIKTTKRSGEEVICPQAECGFKMAKDEFDETQAN